MTVYRWNTTEAAVGYDDAAQHIHPYYTEIQDVILAELRREPADAFTLLDAGGGSGRLIARVLKQFPNARAVNVDQSEPFLALAERRCAEFEDRSTAFCCRLQDDWPAQINCAPDVIVSMSAIHHLDEGEKRDLYQRCHDVLAPGGVFINGDEVRPADEDEYLKCLQGWADHMEGLIRDRRVQEPMYDVMRGWIARNVDRFDEPKQSGDDCHDTVGRQLEMLRECGFVDVDVVWQKDLWAVFLGTRR